MSRIRTAALAVAATLVLSSCTSGTPAQTAPAETSSSAAGFPVTLTHALGEITIPAKPERVASVAWGNQDVAIALGVVPVGMDNQLWSFGGSVEPGVYPWTSEALAKLGGAQPVIFDTTDGLDFEAIADTKPDVVLAALSGISAEDYKTLSEVAPVMAYPKIPWYTSWRDQITYNAQALGLSTEGDALIADIEAKIKSATADAGFTGKKAAFFYASASDLSKISIYAGGDPRTAFVHDLGFELPQAAVDATASGSFYQEFSAENVDQLADVDVIVTYGDDALLPALQADPLWSTVPAVKNGAVLVVGLGDPFSAAVSPTALSITWVLDEYVTKLKAAVEKAG